MARKISVKSAAGALVLSVALGICHAEHPHDGISKFPLAVPFPSDRATEGKLPSVVQVKIRASGCILLNIRYFGANPQCLIDFASARTGTSRLSVTKNDILQSLHPAISLDKITEVSPEKFEIATGTVVEKRAARQPSTNNPTASGLYYRQAD